MNNKRSIYSMYAIALMQGMVFYGPIATLYRQAQGVTLFGITLIESISLLVMIALEIPWGYIADKIGYRQTMVICNSLYFLSKIVFWKADSFAWFLAERLMLSVILSGLSGCDSAYLYTAAKEGESHKVFGLYSAMGTAGLATASIVFSLAVREDFALSGFLTVISYAISMILTFFLKDVPRPKKRHASFKSNVSEVITALKSNKRFFLFLIASMLLLETNQTVTVFLSQVQYLRAGIPVGFMGYLYLLLTLAGLAAAASGKLSHRVGEKKLTKLLFLAAAAACAVTALTASPVLSVLFILLLKLCASLFTPLQMQVQNRAVTIPDRATMLSVYSCVMNSGAAVTNLIFGRLAQADIVYALGAGAAFCTAGLVLYSVWAKKTEV